MSFVEKFILRKRFIILSLLAIYNRWIYREFDNQPVSSYRILSQFITVAKYVSTQFIQFSTSHTAHQLKANSAGRM